MDPECGEIQPPGDAVALAEVNLSYGESAQLASSKVAMTQEKLGNQENLISRARIPGWSISFSTPVGL